MTNLIFQNEQDNILQFYNEGSKRKLDKLNIYRLGL